MIEPMKIINFEKKKMIPLTTKEFESYFNHKNCHICKKKFEDKYTTDKNIVNLGIIQVNTVVLQIVYII